MVRTLINSLKNKSGGKRADTGPKKVIHLRLVWILIISFTNFESYEINDCERSEISDLRRRGQTRMCLKNVVLLQISSKLCRQIHISDGDCGDKF